MRRHAFLSRRAGSARNSGRSRMLRKPAQGGARGLYAALFGLALILFAFDQSGHRIAADTRAFATDLAMPVMRTVAAAVDFTDSAVQTTRDYAHLAEQFEKLKTENERLRRETGETLALEARARAYETLLRYVPAEGTELITARAVTDIESPFARSLVVTAGRERGVANGNAVIGEAGFIGRVISTGQKSARILLITDIDSRIPVFVGEKRHRAILAGTNGDDLALMHMPASARIGDGDVVVTSGEDRLLPSGLAIGTVAMDTEGRPEVAVAAPPGDAELVRIVLSAPEIDLEGGEPPLPFVLQDEAGDIHADSGGKTEIRAAVALEAGATAPSSE